VRLRGIDLEEDGMNLAQLEQALQTEPRARFIYIIANFNNPSGLSTSLAKRHAIYELARQYGVLILEDNPYGDLRFAGEEIPSFKSFDEDQQVIYVGSFSKIIAPGLRVGWIVAPEAIISKVTVAKQASDVHTSALAQIICERFIATADLDAHFAGLRQIYRQKCALMLEELAKNLPPEVTYTRPQGGLFIWCTLPERFEMMEFCRTAAAHKVAVVPGSAFLANATDHTNSFRLNFSTPTDEDIRRGCAILGGLIR
jgi:2-aminoadipate transaminase